METKLQNVLKLFIFCNFFFSRTYTLLPLFVHLGDPVINDSIKIDKGAATENTRKEFCIFSRHLISIAYNLAYNISQQSC